MKKVILIALILLSYICFSFTIMFQTISWETSSKEELRAAYEKAITWFTNNSNCKVDINYFSYSDYATTKPYDHSTGFYKRNNENLHSSAMGITTIQNEKLSLVIDTVNQIIVIKNKSEFNKTPVDSKSLSDLLDNVKSLKKQNRNEGETAYRLDFKPNELYSAFEFIINTKGQFTRIIYYYSREMQQDEENKNSLKGKPRMEINFSGYQTNTSFNYDKEFSEKIFLNEVAGKIVLNGNYKKYEMKDYRFEVKK